MAPYRATERRAWRSDVWQVDVRASVVARNGDLTAGARQRAAHRRQTTSLRCSGIQGRDSSAVPLKRNPCIRDRQFPLQRLPSAHTRRRAARRPVSFCLVQVNSGSHEARYCALLQTRRSTARQTTSMISSTRRRPPVHLWCGGASDTTSPARLDRQGALCERLTCFPPGHEQTRLGHLHRRHRWGE
jgi:hypothetical protein